MFPQVIFVTGAPRSGTTLLAGWLSQFPALPYLPECSVLTDIVRERLRIGAEQHPMKFSAFYGSSERADRLHRRLVAEILEGLAGEGRYLVLKDPYLVFYLNDLPNLMPWPIRTVCIVRDPRDVVASLLQVRKRENAPITVREAVDFELPFYQAAADAAERVDERNPRLFIRYEDFVSKAPAALARLEDFLGFLPDLDGHKGLPLTKLDPSSSWHTRFYEKPITASRVGKHRGKLCVADAAIVQASFAEAMSRLVAACSLPPEAFVEA